MVSKINILKHEFPCNGLVAAAQNKGIQSVQSDSYLHWTSMNKLRLILSELLLSASLWVRGLSPIILVAMQVYVPALCLLMGLIMSSVPLPTSSKFSVSRFLNHLIVAGGLESTSQLRFNVSLPSVRVVWDAVIVTLGRSWRWIDKNTLSVKCVILTVYINVHWFRFACSKAVRGNTGVSVNMSTVYRVYVQNWPTPNFSFLVLPHPNICGRGVGVSTAC